MQNHLFCRSPVGWARVGRWCVAVLTVVSAVGCAGIKPPTVAGATPSAAKDSSAAAKPDAKPAASAAKNLPATAEPSSPPPAEPSSTSAANASNNPEALATEATSGWTEAGVASWYGPRFQGKRTANGERFNTNELTAAHKTLPFGTRVRVKSMVNGKEVVVRINDRGPFIKGRIIDLSHAAAKAIGLIGVKRVEIARLQ